MKYIPLIIITCVLAAASSVSATKEKVGDRFRLTAGLGYDVVSQGYYLSRTDTLTVEEDSLQYLKQASEALDDLRLKSRIEWSIPISSSVRVETDWLNNLSAEDVRSSFVLSLQSGAIRLENDTQLRGIWEMSETTRSGYVTNEIMGRFKPEILDRLFLVVRNSYELVRYDGGSEYDIDYNYNRLSIGLERELGWTGLVALSYRNDTRVVSDSSRLNYTRHRAIFELNWSPTFDVSIGLENELTRTESNKAGGLDDGWKELVECDLGLSLGDRWRMRLKNLFEYVTYDTQDVVDFDYIYNTAEFSASYGVTPYLEIVIEPSALFFQSTYVEFQQQDYKQLAVEYGFDMSRGTWLWLTVSHKIGQRDYALEADEFYTDYVLNQLNILGDLEVLENLRLNTILSVDWESHDLEVEDNTLLLISVGLDYRFR